MRFILRSLGLMSFVFAACTSAYAQFDPAPAPAAAPAPAPAPVAPQAPGISLQIPGVPFSPTISVPIPGMPQAPAAAPVQQSIGAPAAAPVQAAPALSVPIPGVPGAPTLSVPIPGFPQAPAQPAAAPAQPQVKPQAPQQAAPASQPPAAPAPPKPSIAELSFVIDSNVNPDASGRPSPVVVRIYELRSVSAFNKADFFSLYERDKEQLGPELISRDELPLMPGGSPQAITTLRSDTRYLGVIAAFRDIERARWRASTPIFVNQTTRMEIKLDRNEIAIKLQ